MAKRADIRASLARASSGRIISASGLEDFARSAQPGDSLCLGRGVALPADVGAMVNVLAATGILHPARQRISGRDFSFVAQRGSAPFVHYVSGTRPPLRPRKDRRADSPVPTQARRSTDTMLLRLLRWCVAQQRACPTNAELARACGLSGSVAGSYRMRRLVQAEAIRITDYGPFEHRVVTLLTGRRAGQSTPRRLLPSAPECARARFQRETGE